MSEEEKVILPEGFERVEWIENPISSNTSTNGKIILPLDFKFYKDGSGDSSLVFETEHAFSALIHDQNEGITNGSSTQNNNQEFIWTLYNGYVAIHAGEFISFTDLKPKIDEYLKIKIEWTPSLVTFTVDYDGQTYTNSKTPNSTWSCNEIGLFHKLQGPKATVNHRGLNGKKKYCKIWKNGELIYNLVPCVEKENGEACMYDLVSQQVFGNQGTGKLLTEKDYKWNYPPFNNSYNLPAGFKKCVYLQSDGTQFIDLDVYPNNETGLLIKAMVMGESNGCPMGSNNTAPYVYPPRKTLSSERRIAYAWNNWYGAGNNNPSILLNWDKAGDLEYTSFVNYFNSRMVYFNSEDSDIIKPMNSDILPQLETNVRLFNWSTESTMLNSPWIGRIYRAQITQGDALIHDYVPCLDVNGRPCMYDLIESEALYNQSGGTEFAYCVEHQLPNDFIKLKYLEASGTQYIKTGYVPTNTTGLYVDAYCVIDSGTNGVQSGNVMSLRQTNGNTYFSAPRLGKTNSYQTGYGWNSWTGVGGYGDSRYEGYLNWLNNKKYNVKSPLYVEKVGNLSNLSFTPTFDLCMFGNHDYDGKYNGSGYRIYRAKISEGSEIVRDFVPAFDELKLKPCMYDLINNVAYYNDGEGEFLTSRDFEGTYKGFTGLGCIGNRLGTFEFEWKIPYGYRRVAYLESSGKQFIDTKYVPANNTGLKTIAKQISVGDLIPAGCRNDNNSESRFYSGRISLSNSTGYGWCIWNIIVTNDGSHIRSPEKFTSLLNYKNNRKIRIFSTKYNFNANLSELSFTPLHSLHIFGANINNQNQLNWKGRIYEVEISEFEAVIHHFIPCLDPDNKPCMFDIITQQPFYNQGNGEDFTYGTF